MLRGCKVREGQIKNTWAHIYIHDACDVYRESTFTRPIFFDIKGRISLSHSHSQQPLIGNNIFSSIVKQSKMKIALLFLLVAVVTCEDNSNYEGFESSDLQRRVSVETLTPSSTNHPPCPPTGGSGDKGEIPGSGSCASGTGSTRRISPIHQHRPHHQQADRSPADPIPFPGQSCQLLPPSSGTTPPPHAGHAVSVAGTDEREPS